MSSNFAKRLIPMLDRVVIAKMKPSLQTASGIYIPEKSQEGSLQQGTVLAVGPGDKDYKMMLQPGDKVVLPSFGGTPFKCDEETLYIYRENEIPAKLMD